MLKDFQVYQVSKALYKECLKLRLSGAIKNQLERSSLSVCLNLAEGSGKTSKPDRKRFYSIAMGSLREVEACLDLIDDKEIILLADRVGAMLWKLLQNPG